MASYKHRRVTDGATVRHEIYDPKGMAVAVLTDEEWSEYGPDQLATYNEGRTWIRPKKRSVKADVELETGADLAICSPRRARRAALEEFNERGSFAEAVKRVDHPEWIGFARDLFTVLFLNPLDSDRAPTWAHSAVATIRQSEAYERLRLYSQEESWAAGVGAASLLEAYYQQHSEQLEKLLGTLEAAKEQLELAELVHGEESEEAEAARAEVVKVEEQSGSLAGFDDAAALVVVMAAVSELAGIAMARAQVAGLGLGELTRSLTTKRVKHDARVLRLAKMAGRIHLSTEGAQRRSRVKGIPEEVVDVTIGADVGRLLPSELALLADPDTEDLFFKRLLEGETHCYEVAGFESLERGPLIMLIDSSGSMRGERNEWAQALALAMAALASKQSRAFAILHFDHEVRSRHLFERPAETAGLLNAVGEFYDGGTSFSAALDGAIEVLDNVPALKRADVILLTDGWDKWDNQPAELERRGARLFGVALGAEFSDAQRKEMTAYAEITDLSKVEEAEIVFGAI